MKFLNTFLKIIIVTSCLISCENNQTNNVQELLSNPVTQMEIFDTILNNTAYLSIFTDRIMENENSRKTITKNNSLVKMVCNSENADTLYKNDSELTDRMTDRMLRNMLTDSILCDKTCTRMMENDFVKNYFKNPNNWPNKNNSKKQ